MCSQWLEDSRSLELSLESTDKSLTSLGVGRASLQRFLKTKLPDQQSFLAAGCGGGARGLWQV